MVFDRQLHMSRVDESTMSEAVIEGEMVKVQFTPKGQDRPGEPQFVNPARLLWLRLLYTDRILSLSVVVAIIFTLIQYPPLLRIIGREVAVARAMLRYGRILACLDTSRRRGQETERRCGGLREGVRDSQRS